MLHVYLEDIVVKSHEVSQHIDDLREVFLRCRHYNLWMGPLKCVFGVSFGKFMGFIVYKKEIDLDPANAKAIQDMKPSKSYKQLKSFTKRVSYVHKFIPA